MSGHSPGPWTLTEYGDDHALLDADEGRLCVIPASRYLDERNDPTQEANAALIASAPCLLAERDRLRAVNAELVAALSDIQHAATQTPPAVHTIFDITEAAIARAEGAAK